MNGPSNDFMDLGERKRCGSLRRAHRVAPFFLALDAADDSAMGFLEEMGLDFTEDDFGDTGFFEADFAGIGFFETGFLEIALDGLAAVFEDSDWA